MDYIKKIWRPFIWEEIKEIRDNYFVVYNPINKIGVNYASLDLYFTSDLDNNEVANAMEQELNLWICRYPVPILVFASDESDNKIELENIRDGNILLGYLKNDSNQIITSWSNPWSITSPNPSNIVTDKQLEEIYHAIPYKTRDQKEKEIDKNIKEKQNIKKFIDFKFGFWLFIILIISFLGWQNYLVGASAFFYSLYKGIRELIRFKGYKTKKELEKIEKINKMKHYYYHCELNPIGFLRLKSENFEVDEREKIREKIELTRYKK